MSAGKRVRVEGGQSCFDTARGSWAKCGCVLRARKQKKVEAASLALSEVNHCRFSVRVYASEAYLCQHSLKKLFVSVILKRSSRSYYTGGEWRSKTLLSTVRV